MLSDARIGANAALPFRYQCNAVVLSSVRGRMHEAPSSRYYEASLHRRAARSA